MTMPKGFKVENGYATSAELGGKSYHQIAEIMTDRGFKMNHSTARNITVDSLKKLAEVVANFHDVKWIVYLFSILLENKTRANIINNSLMNRLYKIVLRES